MDSCCRNLRLDSTATSPQFSKRLWLRSRMRRCVLADSLGGRVLSRLCAMRSSLSAAHPDSAPPILRMRLCDSDTLVSAVHPSSSSPTSSIWLPLATSVLSRVSPAHGSRESMAFSLAMSAASPFMPATPASELRRLPLTFSTRTLDSAMGVSAASVRLLFARLSHVRLASRASARTLSPADTTLSLRSSLLSAVHCAAREASTPLMPFSRADTAVTRAGSPPTLAPPRATANLASSAGIFLCFFLCPRFVRPSSDLRGALLTMGLLPTARMEADGRIGGVKRCVQ
mmetsp:Transcript_38325/g.95101  ORF Transcript_38325/g.95101 Transcript_38325/m.95101 type:complete len:286 (+) Transcript_38325:118-975(+)